MAQISLLRGLDANVSGVTKVDGQALLGFDNASDLANLYFDVDDGTESGVLRRLKVGGDAKRIIEENNLHPTTLWVGTKAEYDEIGMYDDDTIYITTDESESGSGGGSTDAFVSFTFEEDANDNIVMKAVPGAGSAKPVLCFVTSGEDE